MKKLIYLCVLTLIAVACNNSNTDNSKSNEPAVTPTETSGGNPSYDPKRGEGPFTKVDISATLNVAKADAGQKVYAVKCSACHKLTDEKLVGPGWKGVTSRHTAEWIMNFASNPDEMITKDPKAQAMLEICLVRMPNQNLTGDDARNVYEFMRQNDGVK
ncbi:MAG: cytochrome c [Bacteroidota bacterium]|nr:cytochrome c [Bacteroidota bacterium]